MGIITKIFSGIKSVGKTNSSTKQNDSIEDYKQQLLEILKSDNYVYNIKTVQKLIYTIGMSETYSILCNNKTDNNIYNFWGVACEFYDIFKNIEDFNFKDFFLNSITTPKDMLVIAAYLKFTKGRNNKVYPRSINRAIREAFDKFDSKQLENCKDYKNIRIRDIICKVHPKPTANNINGIEHILYKK